MKKDDLGDPYGLYEESYWDSVRAKDKKKEPTNAGSKNQSEGRSDQVAAEEPKRKAHKRRGRPKKGAKRRPYNRRSGSQNKKPTTLDKILS